MSEPTAPKLKPHHGYQSWTTTWYDPTGARRGKRFGREGETTKAEALARYKNWRKMEFDAHQHVRDPRLFAATYQVKQLADDYLKHAQATFRKHGRPTSHVETIDYAMRALKAHLGESVAAEVESHEIAKLRDSMIHGQDRHGIAFIRSIKTINSRLYAIKQAFKWAATEKGYIPFSTAGGIQFVDPLAKGRSEAKDPKKVQPVPWQIVASTMRASPPVLRDMIKLQWLTGMRSEELCQIQPRYLKSKGGGMSYFPPEYKTERTEDQKSIPIGPRTLAVLKPYLKRPKDEYCFSPAESYAQLIAMRNAKPNRKRRKATPMVKPGTHYNKNSYRRAVWFACRRAGLNPWHPHQLRHSFSTRVSDRHGIEAASIAVGHKHIQTTEIYAKRSERKARNIANKVG